MNLLFLNNLVPDGFQVPNFFSTTKLSEPDKDTSIDETITNFLLGYNQKAGIASICLPVSLNSNFLEFTGLTLAHHLRLTKELYFREIPIIFFGAISSNYIAKMTPLASILFTPNVYYVDLNNYNFDQIAESIKKINRNKKFDFDKYLNYTNIESPANYDSHHTIANDWALARYFSMFKPDYENADYNELKSKVSKLTYPKTLHYKYVESKAERQLFNREKHYYTPQLNNIAGVRIGIIDDEAEKGWGDFYKYFLGKAGGDVEIFNFQADESKTNLLMRLEQWIKDVNIDLFIIDLRLHDEDFEKINSEDLSGNKIISYIKSECKGKQIIVATASNKIWNFKQSIDLGVSSFIVKESPETFDTREKTKESLRKLAVEVDSAIDKLFLADLYRRLKFLRNNYKIDSSEKLFSDLVFSKNGILYQIFELLNHNYKSDSILNQCLLLCFQILENYCDLSSVGNFGSGAKNGNKASSGFIWKKDNTKQDIYVNIKEDQKSSRFEIVYGTFPFMIANSNSTVTTYNVFDNMKVTTSLKSGLDSSALIKIISVLHYRENIKKEDINKIIKLRYYRSNVSAHYTGKINRNHRITAKDDIIFFISIFEKIFLED